MGVLLVDTEDLDVVKAAALGVPHAPDGGVVGHEPLQLLEGPALEVFGGALDARPVEPTDEALQRVHIAQVGLMRCAT